VEGLLITLKIYRHVCLRAATLAARNWPVLATIFIYLAILKIAGNLSARLGIAGGFIFSLVFAACLGSFLYLVEMIVRTYKVSLNDFRNSFGQYLWEVVGVLFIFWILGLIAPAILQLPQGGSALNLAPAILEHYPDLSGAQRDVVGLGMNIGATS